MMRAQRKSLKRFDSESSFVFRFGFAALTGLTGVTGFPFVFIACLFGTALGPISVLLRLLASRER
jgi:hypothetical protein